MSTTMQSATGSSRDDEEVSLLLNPGNTELALSPEADCFPLDGVIGVAGASAPALHEAIRTRNANLAREVLARAEDEVRDLRGQGLLAADWTARSADIVALAQREVSEILARGGADPEAVAEEPGADPEAVAEEPGADPEAVAEEPGTAPTAEIFASLRAFALPSEESGLRYQVSGQLTLATLLAFQQAVSHLPGVNSARVDAQPDDRAVLSVTTDNNDSSRVHRLLVGLPGIHLEMEAA